MNMEPFSAGAADADLFAFESSFPEASFVRPGLIRLVLKRALDIVAALALLAFLAPLLLVVACLVSIDSRGPSLFRQHRTGLNGRVFRIYKFRTMHCCEDGAELAQATSHDARVTSFGRVLRRTSLDELPQLFNVLSGEMSLVGPRPHALAHDRYYSALIPGYERRFRVKPGITGLAQVRGLRGETRTIACMVKRVRADLEYAANCSLSHDVRLLLRSALIVFRGEGV
jgi:putative colanic acid biosynthesis UDP-glucose lipid carrier transferase